MPLKHAFFLSNNDRDESAGTSMLSWSGRCRPIPMWSVKENKRSPEKEKKCLKDNGVPIIQKIERTSSVYDKHHSAYL